MTGDQRRVRLSRRNPIRDTLQIMVRLVHQRRDDRRIRDVALTITAGCPRGDIRCRQNRILAYARHNLRYERDPHGNELIFDPVDTLDRIGANGQAAGDCDDGTVLVSALLESIGIPTRLVAVSIRPDRRLHHVAVEARDPSGFWRYLDPFLRSRRGLPSFTRIMRVNV